MVLTEILLLRETWAAASRWRRTNYAIAWLRRLFTSSSSHWLVAERCSRRIASACAAAHSKHCWTFTARQRQFSGSLESEACACFPAGLRKNFRLNSILHAGRPHSTLCPKKAFPIFSIVTKKTSYQILIIFGTSIPDTTCHQMIVQFPTSPNICFCIT